MTTYTYVDNLSDLVPDIPADSIISRNVYTDERVRVVLFRFAPGQELSEHTASQAAIIHFLNGEAQLTLGSDAKTASAGTWVQMPPQLPHSIVAKTPVTMLLLFMKTPRRGHE